MDSFKSIDMQKECFISMNKLTIVLILFFDLKSLLAFELSPSISLNEKKGAEVTESLSEDTLKLTEYNWKEKWVKFKTEHENREFLNDRKRPRSKSPGYECQMKWSEAKGECVNKYFPGHKIFSQYIQVKSGNDTSWSTCASGTNIFIVREKDGQITYIGNSFDSFKAENWPLNKKFESNNTVKKSYNSVLKDQKIKIADNKSAIEMVQLYKIISGVMDDNKWKEHIKEWKYKATKNNSKWIISIYYTGNASIIVPPDYIIQINNDNHFLGMESISWSIIR